MAQAQPAARRAPRCRLGGGERCSPGAARSAAARSHAHVAGRLPAGGSCGRWRSGAQQFIERDARDGEDRDAQQRLAIQRPGTGGSGGVAGPVYRGCQGRPAPGPSPQTAAARHATGRAARSGRQPPATANVRSRPSWVGSTQHGQVRHCRSGRDRPDDMVFPSVSRQEPTWPDANRPSLNVRTTFGRRQPEAARNDADYGRLDTTSPATVGTCITTGSDLGADLAFLVFSRCCGGREG